MTEPSGRRRLSGAQIVVEYLVAPGRAGRGRYPGSRQLGRHRCPPRPPGRDPDRAGHARAVGRAPGRWLYRATGRPILAFTSIGPGARPPSSAWPRPTSIPRRSPCSTGSAHTYMRGGRAAPGARSPARRGQPASSSRSWKNGGSRHGWTSSPSSCTAWNPMLSDRPGLILLDLPMDVLAEAAEVSLPSPTSERRAVASVRRSMMSSGPRSC